MTFLTGLWSDIFHTAGKLPSDPGESNEKVDNNLDISQTIVDGFFNMMMICDANNASKEFLTLSEELETLGKKLGCIIKLQREEIFDSMQRI